MEIKNYVSRLGHGIKEALNIRSPIAGMGYLGLGLAVAALAGEGLSNQFPGWHLDTSAARLEEILGFGMFAIARIGSHLVPRTAGYDG